MARREVSRVTGWLEFEDMKKVNLIFVMTTPDYIIVVLHHWIQIGVQLSILIKTIKQIMQVIEHVAAVMPYGDAVLHRAEEVYDYSKGRTLNAYKNTKQRISDTRKNYRQFRKSVEQVVINIAQETIIEVLSRTERFVGIDNSSKTEEELKEFRERLQIIVVTIYQQHILKSRLLATKQAQALIKLGKQYSAEYIEPMYINLRAVLIVSKQMLLEFLESRFNQIKLTYESSKDNVVMFVTGNFNEESLKKKVFEGIDQFKRFTVKVVSTGLEIRVDKESLMENYDKFAVNFLELVKEMREKSECNIGEVKKKSKDLYNEVISRIRAKELQLRAGQKTLQPELGGEQTSHQ